MSDVRSGFGKAKEGTGINIFKVGEDKTEQYRIFPPKGKLASKGVWAVYHQQHYGYTVPNPQDPSKPKHRPFVCVEEKDGDLVTVSCPECRKREDMIRTRDDLHKAESKRLTDAGKSPAEAEAMADKLVSSHNEWLSSHNLDKKFYLIAKSVTGEIGFLTIGYKTHKALKVKKDKLLKDEKIDLLDLDGGAWIEITRTGKFRNTEYTVDIAQEHKTFSDGARAKVTKVSGFTDQDLETALALPDLDVGPYLRRVSRDQIKMLADGSGAPEEVEAILNMGERLPPRQESSPVAPRPAPVPETAKIQVQTVPSQPSVPNDQASMIAALQAQLAALTAPKAIPVPAMPSQDIKSMSNEEFAAKFGSIK